MEKVVFSWSGGKDSALALYKIQQSKQYEIVSLLTTLTDEYKRTSMHGIRENLLEKQTNSLNIPLHKIFLPKNGTNETYGKKMTESLQYFKDQGVTKIVFGDIFLEDVRKYREDNLKQIGMKGIFPLWGQKTENLSKEFFDLGFSSIICCIDSQKLEKKFVGRYFDKNFISDLPSNIDVMGENGEFHSFVYAGPNFQKHISFDIGNFVFRENRFWYCDLIP